MFQVSTNLLQLSSEVLFVGTAQAKVIGGKLNKNCECEMTVI